VTYIIDAFEPLLSKTGVGKGVLVGAIVVRGAAGIATGVLYIVSGSMADDPAYIQRKQKLHAKRLGHKSSHGTGTKLVELH